MQAYESQVPSDSVSVYMFLNATKSKLILNSYLIIRNIEFI